MQKTDETLTPAQAGKLAEQARRADWSAQAALCCLVTGRATTEGKTPVEHLREMREATGQVSRALSRHASVDRIGERQAGALDLSELATLSSPRARRLLDLLEAAMAEAEAVDVERGLAVGADLVQPGEPRGIDLADQLYALVVRLRREVQGPKGRE